MLVWKNVDQGYPFFRPCWHRGISRCHALAMGIPGLVICYSLLYWTWPFSSLIFPWKIVISHSYVFSSLIFPLKMVIFDSYANVYQKVIVGVVFCLPNLSQPDIHFTIFPLLLSMWIWRLTNFPWHPRIAWIEVIKPAIPGRTCPCRNLGHLSKLGEPEGFLNFSYPLVICYSLLLKMTIYSELSHQKWWFSIVM